MNKITVTVNEFCRKAYVKSSTIDGAGLGLFARQDIMKGDEICTFGGVLIDPQEAIYTDPTYMVNFENGRGFKLVGSNLRGDLGHFANSIHHLFPQIKQNARIKLSGKFTDPSSHHQNMLVIL